MIYKQVCTWSKLIVPGCTLNSSVRRRPNCFNLVHQLEFLSRTGVSREHSVASLEVSSRANIIFCFCLWPKQSVQGLFWFGAKAFLGISIFIPGCVRPMTASLASRALTMAGRTNPRLRSTCWWRFQLLSRADWLTWWGLWVFQKKKMVWCVVSSVFLQHPKNIKKSCCNPYNSTTGDGPCRSLSITSHWRWISSTMAIPQPVAFYSLGTSISATMWSFLSSCWIAWKAITLRWLRKCGNPLGSRRLKLKLVYMVPCYFILLVSQ